MGSYAGSLSLLLVIMQRVGVCGRGRCELNHWGGGAERKGKPEGVLKKRELGDEGDPERMSKQGKDKLSRRESREQSIHFIS